MIIVKLQGGLGNQMFQYALGRNLSLIHGVPLKIDSLYLRSANQSGRSLVLDKFNIVADEATTQEISMYQSIVQKILDKVRPDSRRKKVLEHSSIFSPEVLKRSDGYFEGHWNSEKYFKTNAETVRKDFKLKKPFGEMARIVSKKITTEPQATSIHIRRGDYVSIKKIADTHGILPISYYENAMDKIKEKFPDAHFFIFSDDIAWAKENFPKKYPATLVSAPEIKDYEELTLMSICKHNIIANSSFSWWSAWLNNNRQKMVIAPKKWFKIQSYNEKRETPKTWHILENN